MKKLFFIGSMLVVSLSLSCNQAPEITEKEEATETAETQESKVEKLTPKGTIYRCDGTYPGISSEWVQLDYNDETGMLRAIWYWNTKNEDKVQLTILNQESHDGEISGQTGQLKFDGNPTHYSFANIEDEFRLMDDDGFFQTYTYDQ